MTGSAYRALEPQPVTFSSRFIDETVAVLQGVDRSAIEDCVVGLARVRERRGRLFILGVGGSAGHASHAVNDFRKLCDSEAYAPTDNVSELTSRIKDEGWETAFEGWLRGSRLDQRDGLLVFSVGGGDRIEVSRPTWWRPWNWPVSARLRFSP